MRRALLLSIVVTAAALAGCGQSNPNDTLQEEAVQVYASQKVVLENEDSHPQAIQMSHEMTASGLKGKLEKYPDADENLRQVLSDIQEGERRLADGEVSGSEAEELIRTHQEYWEHLENGDLPPDYR